MQEGVRDRTREHLFSTAVVANCPCGYVPFNKAKEQEERAPEAVDPPGCVATCDMSGCDLRPQRSCKVGIVTATEPPGLSLQQNHEN